ncbi:DUF4157 domain-containing protein [Streptomyces sp. NPDC048717]|uniref:eCIS core domain-containing protein n=1 Tax=Streptomyces sp. NPDC048717 TaxID=3154928 RepID=UPI003414B761
MAKQPPGVPSVTLGEPTMSAYDQGHPHEHPDHEHHDHEQYDHGQYDHGQHGHDPGHGLHTERERDTGRGPDGDLDTGGTRDDGPRTARLFEAAAAGRTDIVGASGLGVLQRAAGNGAVGALVRRSRATASEETEGAEGAEPAGTRGARSPVHDVLASGGGRPLDADTRGDMEARMGADFSDVRIHTDAAADASAKGIGAHAYTVGSDVVFQRDAYDPASPQGRTTLAHELTHVIQQRGGPVDGTEAPGGIRVSDPSDRFEQEAVANAERVTADPAPVRDFAPAPVSAIPAAPAVQRAATEDEDEQPADVQGSFVQRAAEGGAEDEEEAPPS